MPIIPFGEYRPDLARTKNSKTLNVLPQADGYGPFREFGALTSSLAAGAPIADPFIKVLLHFNGTDTSTTITDDATGGAVTWTAAGNAQIDTAQSVFGGASLLCDGTGDWVTASDSADVTLGSSNFHLHMRLRPATIAALNIAGQCNSSATAATASFTCATNIINQFVFKLSNGSAFTTLTSTSALTAAAWWDIEVSRAGNNLYLFVNGVSEATGVFSGAVNDSANDIRVGAAGEVTASPWEGWIDEFMLAVGQSGHTTNFTPEDHAFDAAAGTSISPVCRGLFYARRSDGSIQVFAANINRLFTYNPTTHGWTDISVAAGYADLPTSYNWQFAQFGNFVIAVQPNVVPQVFTLNSSSVFSALAGSPPQAAYIAVVQSFVVLTGLTSTPFRIQWSGLEDATNWTSGSNSSDFQDLPDGGIVRGVVGGDFGVIFQDSVIRRMIWNQSTSTVFDINKIVEEQGLLAPYSVAKAGGNIYFLSQQGFQRVGLTGSPFPIGKEKVDRTTLADVDMESLRLFIGAGDPQGSRVMWMYKSVAGRAGLADRLLVYDYALERFTSIEVNDLEYLATLSMPGTTLDALDAIFPSLDTMPISLDDLTISQLPRIAAFNSTHCMGMFAGQTMAAKLETTEQILDVWHKVRVQGVWPITDAQSLQISLVSRAGGPPQTFVFRGLVDMNDRGWVPFNINCRSVWAFMLIPENTYWTYATGIDPMFKLEGRW